MKPLAQWKCDFCGGLIESPKDAWIEWYDDENHKAQGFKIVHYDMASPNYPNNNCYHYNNHARRRDLPLNGFLGQSGMLHLLPFLDPGPWHMPDYTGPEVFNVREFVELFRRLQTPYYEEARLYWSDARADGIFSSENEVSIYGKPLLKHIIDTYKNK